MRIPFRQGIVRYQTDDANPVANPTFLQRSNGGASIDLVVAPNPTIVTIAHGNDHDYLIEESLSISQAWVGFTTGSDYWLYIDIDVNTARRTFGWTTLEPVYGPTMPVGGVPDLHWFDTTNKVMKVMNDTGYFVEKLRVFLAKYEGGAVINPLPYGSQVGLDVQATAGTILFDENGDPVLQGRNRRVGRFAHTETNFSTHASSGTMVKLEAVIEVAEAVNNIAAYQLVAYKGANRIGYASSDDPTSTIVGISREAMFVGEVGSYVSQGTVTNPSWNWSEPAGTSLFCDATGQVTTSVPQVGAFQRVGQIISPTTVLINIGAKYTIL